MRMWNGATALEYCLVAFQKEPNDSMSRYTPKRNENVSTWRIHTRMLYSTDFIITQNNNQKHPTS